MKRRFKVDESFQESRIISTDDIYIGTDPSDSLGAHIEEQDKEIENLKKWTKWYVKYGGMGSGGGGGGQTEGFGHKIYFKDLTTSQELTGSVINLWGQGDYTISFNLNKTQGHAFTIKYKIGNGSWITKTLSEGNTTLDVAMRLTTKIIFTYIIIDTTTDIDTGEISFTIIPESFNIVPSLDYRNGGSVSSQQISYQVATENLRARFTYSIYENIEVFWKIRYKLETDSEWTEYNSPEHPSHVFPYSSAGDTVSGDLSIDLDLSDLVEESVIGREIIFELIYGLSETSPVTPAGKKTVTIIPTGKFYILLTDKEGRLYLDEPSPDSYDSLEKLKKGFLPFFINLCSGTEDEKPIRIDINHWENDSWVEKLSSTQTLKSNTLQSVADRFRISVSESGLYQIKASINNDENYTTIKYFYVKEDASNWSYTQYTNESPDRKGIHLYYPGSRSPKLGIPVTIYGSSVSAEFDSEIIDNTIRVSNKYNYNIAIGIQYDRSNDDNLCFLQAQTINNALLKVYQNKILLGDNIIIDEYYFPKTTNSNETDRDLWHLLNINVNFVRTDPAGTQYFYEFTVYVDGVMEAVSKGQVGVDTSTALSNDYKFIKFIINPENRHIIKLNHFDVGFTALSDSVLFNERNGDQYYRSYGYMYDIYATTYYNKYKADLGFDDKEILDTSSFSTYIESFKFNEYGIPYTSGSNLSSIINAMDSEGNNRLLKVPVLVLCPDERSSLGEGNFFRSWFSALWPENSAIAKPITISGYIHYVEKNYNPGTRGKEISEFIVRQSDGSLQGFSFDIQGSSTRAFGIKNIELSINQSETNFKIFTPNFDAEDTDSFLPEKSFTLKADMVDSSTCNNNAIGGFVNKNTKPLDYAHCPARSTRIGGHIKNCLTGFPVLVFINIDNALGAKDHPDEYYYIGVYNFNLGRKSYFNLGYYNEYPSEIVDDLMDGSDQGDFKILSISAEPSFTPNLAVTEISNGSEYFDFSQFDPTVLFGSDTDDYSMFSHDDSLFSREVESKNMLSAAIKQISRAGGYIFKTLGKNFEDINKHDGLVYMIHKDGVSCNYVSNYQTQYKRITGTSDFEPKTNEEPEAMSNDLIECIGLMKEDSDGQLIPNDPYLDLRSTVEYYVICMAFGMVDSVLKNLELKSWNNKTIFPAFYDMDTALGVNNNGESVDFFAFSDYWQNSTTPVQGFEDRVRANGVEIYPDFFNTSSGYKGYDIPSSYLFAIAKYATMKILSGNGGDFNELFPKLSNTETGSGMTAPLSPVNVYSLYRCDHGDLSDAETFMKKYFTGRLDGIPNSLRNLNYRSKYAKSAYWLLDGLNANIDNKETSQTMKVSGLSDIGKFKGTGVAKKTDWLSYRLHLLDAYFNLNNDVKYRVRTADITKSGEEVTNVVWRDIPNGENSFWYYPVKTGLNVTFTKDVTITQQIFSKTDGTKDTLNIQNLLIKAPSFTPVVLYKAGSSPVPYLIGDDTKKTFFQISINTTGNQEWGVFGSKTFTYVNNLGLFRLSNSTVSSDNLENATYTTSSEIGSTLVMQNFNLNTPNVETITVSGSNYSGNLQLSASSYNRLISIDLHDSKINSENSHLSLPMTILDLRNINSQQGTISFPNSDNLETVSLDGAKIQKLSLPLWKSSISITSNNAGVSGTSSFDYHSVEIRDLVLHDQRNLSGGAETFLTIQDMPKLETLDISGINHLKIVNCVKLRSIAVSNSLKTVYISGCATSSAVSKFTVGLDVNNNIGLLDFSSQTGLTSLYLYGTRKFNRIDIGSNQVELASSALSNCTELEYLDESEGEYTIAGTSVFQYDYNLKLKYYSKSGYPRVLFKIGLTDASNTFNCSSHAGSIDYAAADAFLTNNCSYGRHQNITNITQLFYNHPNIGTSFTGFDSSSKTKFTDLHRYEAITTCTHAFAACGINWWTKELYNFGANGISFTGAFYCSSVNAKLNFLENIGSKLSYFNDSGPNGAECSYTFYDNTTNAKITGTVKMSNILGHLGDRITSLYAFPRISGSTIDLKDCFASCTGLKLVKRFIRSGSNWCNLIYTDPVDSTKKTSCFRCLSGLNNLDMCFEDSSTVSGNESIDLINLLSESQWKAMSTIFSDGLPSNYTNQFSAKKRITREDLNSLLNWISKNPKITIISSIFKNCDVFSDDGQEVKIKFPFTSNNTKISYLHHTFSGMKAYKNNGQEEMPIIIEEDFFRRLPNITTIRYAFANIWVGNPKGIPFNFFGKRSNAKTGRGYYPDRVTQILPATNVSDNEYIYYISDSASTEPPTLPENPDTDKPVEDITDGYYTESNDHYTGKWTYNIPSIKTNMSNRALWRAQRTKSVNPLGEIVYGDEWTDCNWYEIFNDPIEVEAKYFTYSGQKITNIEGIFYNCKWSTPCWIYHGDDIEGDTFLSENRSYIRKVSDPSKEYDEYFIDRNCTSKVTSYRSGVEISDLENVVCDRVDQPVVGGKRFANYPLYHDVKGLERSYPFIPTDFFLGVSSTCNISNAFTSTSTTGVTTTGNGIYTALEGYIPEHLLRPITRINGMTDWIANLNILPVQYGNTRYYSFVPPKFITQSISVISGLLNFHIRVPNHFDNPSDINDNHIYCIMYSNSLNVSGSASFNNALPKYCLHGSTNNSIIWSPEPADVCKTNYDFGYSMILHVDQEGDPSLGYVNTYFPGAIYNHMFSSDLLYVYSGYIWDPDFTLNNIKNNGELVFDGVVTYSSTQVGFNKNCIVPKATDTFNGKNIFYSVSRINRTSIQSTGNDEIKNYWVGTFPALEQSGRIL